MEYFKYLDTFIAISDNGLILKKFLQFKEALYMNFISLDFRFLFDLGYEFCFTLESVCCRD